MALTKIQAGSFAAGAIQTADLSSNTTAAFANSATFADFATSLAPKVTSVNVANSAFTVLDDTAVNVGGGYIVITGTNFAEGATVLIDTTPASSVARVDSTTLRVQVPAKAASTYNLFVVNPDGGTGIRVSGLTYSGTPTWVTSSPLTSQQANVAFSVSLDATGANTYSVAAGSTLPAGTSLLSNGYFYGTSTVGVETSFSFNIVATDIELQDSPKTFALTVTVVVPARLFFFGREASGMGGVNTVAVTYSSPVQVGALTNWSVDASIFSDSTAVVKNDGTLWAWGSNGFGKAGLGDQIARSSPVQVGSSTDWASVTWSNNALLALKKTGTLWAAGLPSVLDYPTPVASASFRSSMVQIGSISNWRQISASGSSQILAIRTDGTLWAWGEGYDGATGLNVTTVRSSPVQLGTGTDWSFVNMDGNGSTHNAMAIKTDGTLWGWGTNTAGQLGLNDVIVRSSPVQVGTGTDWSTISQSSLAQSPTLAVKTNGTLWSWGGNSYGGLGTGSAGAGERRSSPVQVGALTNWRNASAARFQSYAVKTDGTLWAWGGNVYGTMGINNTSAAYSPIQIGTQTNWSKIISKNNAFAAVLGLTRES